MLSDIRIPFHGTTVVYPKNETSVNPKTHFPGFRRRECASSASRMVETWRTCSSSDCSGDIVRVCEAEQAAVGHDHRVLEVRARPKHMTVCVKSLNNVVEVVLGSRRGGYAGCCTLPGR